MHIALRSSVGSRTARPCGLRKLGSACKSCSPSVLTGTPIEFVHPTGRLTADSAAVELSVPFDLVVSFLAVHYLDGPSADAASHLTSGELELQNDEPLPRAGDKPALVRSSGRGCCPRDR